MICYDILLCFLVVASHSPSISAILQTKPELADLVNWVVPMAADKWEMICVLLMGDEGQTIGNAIRREFQLIEECCLEMFSEWLQYRDATWQNIIDVLISVRKLALAEELTERLGVLCVCMCVVWCGVCSVCAVCMCAHTCVHICLIIYYRCVYFVHCKYLLSIIKSI